MFSALLIWSMTSLDWRTTARPSSAGMIPTLRTPASASPSGPSAAAGRLVAPQTNVAPIATTANLFKLRIDPSHVLFVGSFSQKDWFVTPLVVSIPAMGAAIARWRLHQRSPPHIDVLHLRITHDFIEAFFFTN